MDISTILLAIVILLIVITGYILFFLIPKT